MRIIILVLFVWSCQLVRGSKDCQRPKLRRGFLVPQQENYEHGSSVFYGCHANARTPASAWWGELKCDDGVWSHSPVCLDESECAAPDVSHAQPLHKLEGWYSNNSSVTYACDKGYELVGKALAVCINGKWILPECKRKVGACGSPAPVANAVITQAYRDIFEHTERVDFMCENGYKIAGHQYSYCMNEEWTPLPNCGREDHTSPTLIADSTPSHVGLCGPYPSIENGDVYGQPDGSALKVQCARLYKLEGPDEVMCVNKEWTAVPVCKEPCKLDRREFPEYIEHGEQMYKWCSKYWENLYVKCDNGRALYRGCGHNDW